MKLMKRTNTVVSVLAMLTIVSCGKDDPQPGNSNNPDPIEKHCLIMQDSSSNGGNMNKYFYDTEGKVIRIERKNYSQGEFYELLEYDNAGKLIRNNFYGQDSVLFKYCTYQYNASGQISSLTGFNRNAGILEEWGHESFAYDSNGKLIERAEFSSPQATYPYIIYKFTHLSNNLIEERDFSANAAGNLQLDRIIENRYDDKKNPYASLSNAINMNIFTEHNIVSWRNYDLSHTYYNETIVSYQYNAEGYPIKETHSDGQRQFDSYFTYNCQ